MYACDVVEASTSASKCTVYTLNEKGITVKGLCDTCESKCLVYGHKLYIKTNLPDEMHSALDASQLIQEANAPK